MAQPKHSQAQQPPPQAQQPPSQAQQPPSRAEQGQPAPSPSRQHSERPRERGSSSLANAAILVGVGAVLASIFSAPSEQGPAPAINDDYLARNGPRFAVTQKVGTFVVEGYIRSGWPFVVDFLPQPDTCTELDVYLGGKQVFSRLLDADGRAGRRLLRIELPGNIAPAARAALYVLRSARPACAERGAVADEGGVSVEVYGIGAGPRAVGSVAVDRLVFGPPQPKLPRELVQVGYRMQWPFNHVAVEVLRFRRSGADGIEVERVATLDAEHSRGLPAGEVAGQTWDGRNGAAALSRGLHRLQVRAWLAGDDRSWVGAISPGAVRIADHGQ
ncbi:hypothetical protein [Rugamonas sp. DEMB1]|uniref:hypothetical protein n=1 Tax=Rugamonas sp. DEMB1 TaxID=3039386 RepID=UPI002448EE36|nr:hypothetical protein [Rugamonas sp. DEMB1]WGG48215.1 hypothetical protein QC826_15900 [Rugamonas sp. DEMB1]